MQSLSHLLGALPGIRPRTARKLILEGDLLSTEERADIYSRDHGLLDTVLLVGADAAASILAAYKDSRLPMQKGVKPTAAPLVEEYIAGSDKIREEVAERKRRERAVKDTSLILERDLVDHSFIDRVFFENIGPGPGSMVLAGITVRKEVIGHKTNSGQNTGWRVRFDWVGSDGQPRHSEVVPPEASNRRNDPDRNWGLHE